MRITLVKGPEASVCRLVPEEKTEADGIVGIKAAPSQVAGIEVGMD